MLIITIYSLKIVVHHAKVLKINDIFARIFLFLLFFVWLLIMDVEKQIVPKLSILKT